MIFGAFPGCSDRPGGAADAGSTATSGPTAREISLTALAEVGDIEGPGQVYEQARVFRDQRGRILVTARPAAAGMIQIFDSTGSYLSSVGRRGRGPGEFQFPMHIEMAGEGDYLVYDPGLRRVTRLTPDFEVSGSTTLGANAADFARLSDGTLIATFLSRNPAESAHPFHVLSEDGSTIVRSFGGSEDSARPVHGVAVMRRITPSRTRSALWSARLNSYLLEEWTSDGELLQSVNRTPDWFQPWETPIGSPLENPPQPTIGAIQQDSAGLIWVLVHVASEDWKPMPPARLEGGEAYRSDAQDNMIYDTVIEVLNPSTGEVLASTRVDGYVEGFAGPQVVYFYLEDAIGNPRYRLERLSWIGR